MIVKNWKQKRKPTGNTGVRAEDGRLVYAGQWVQCRPVNSSLTYTKGVVTRYKRRWVIDHKLCRALTDLRYCPVRHLYPADVMDYLMAIHLAENLRIIKSTKVKDDHSRHIKEHRRLWGRE